jgi:hypothetical protein
MLLARLCRSELHPTLPPSKSVRCRRSKLYQSSSPIEEETLSGRIGGSCGFAPGLPSLIPLFHASRLATGCSLR